MIATANNDNNANVMVIVEDARTMAAKYLAKYRPGFVEAATANNAEETSSTTGTAIAA